MRKIRTVGHSTLPLEKFLRFLANIEVLADLRRLPGSRRHPHFAQESLRQAKECRWLEALGGRRSGPADRHLPLRKKAFRACAAHLEGAAFGEALADLEALVTVQRKALTCAEGAWFRWHRRLVSDLLEARGWAVLHLPGDQPHQLTEGARCLAGAVPYDRADVPGSRPSAPNAC
jgi:uncharacterized protein (DUF488 family)